jgi:hypothetical protein
MSQPNPTWSHADWICYFRTDLKRVVDAGFRPLVASRSSFAIPRQFFALVEHLSGMLFGNVNGKSGRIGGTDLVLNFLQQHMVHCDPLYFRHAEVLLAMWRHGSAYTFQPTDLQDGQGKRIGWLSYFEHQRKDARAEHPPGNMLAVSHLTPTECIPLGMDLLPVSIPCLVKDLDDILERIAKQLEGEKAAGGNQLQTNLRKAAQRMATPISGNITPFTW